MIRFVKAHACGNDFLIVDADAVAGRIQGRNRDKDFVRGTRVLARDGVEYLQTASRGGGRIQLYNADGSMAEISGNGTRLCRGVVWHASKAR